MGWSKRWSLALAELEAETACHCCISRWIYLPHTPRWYHHVRMQDVVYTIGAFGRLIGRATLDIQRTYRGFRTRRRLRTLLATSTHAATKLQLLNRGTRVNHGFEARGVC